jgi:hypothetical protein
MHWRIESQFYYSGKLSADDDDFANPKWLKGVIDFKKNP